MFSSSSRHWLTQTAALLIPMCLSGHALADKVNFDGTVIAGTCAIKINGVSATNSGTSTINLSLPAVASSLLSASGSTAGSADFSVELAGCNATGSTFNTKLLPNSSADVDINGTLKILTGGASNVALQLQSAPTVGGSYSPITLTGSGTTIAGTLTGSSGSKSGVLPLRVVYYATGAATVGKVNASMNILVDYQ